MVEISVIVPVYKAEQYIEDCVQSILKQTYKSFELILVDDGSPDRSGALCDALAQTDSRIRVLHQENGGAASARNAGLDIAEGRYIAFVDGDDMIHPQYLEFLLTLLECQNADVSWCHYDFFTDSATCFARELDIQAETSGCVVSCGEAILAEFSQHCRRVSLISLCMKLFKREIFEGMRIPEGFIEEDSMVLPMILERTGTISRIKLPLYHWRETPGSVTRSGLSPKSFAYIEVSRSQAEFFRKRGSEQANYCMREYLYKSLKYYYRIQDQSMELMEAFAAQIKQYRRLYPHYIRAKGLCTKEKIAYTLFLISPKAARKFYMQVHGARYNEETW